MDVELKKIKSEILNDKGQAIVEFIVFLPIMLVTYTLIVTVTASINASINQQKATRSYFYRFMKQNSYAPLVSTIGSETFRNIKNLGMYSIGWHIKSDDNARYAECFKLNGILNEDNGETCDRPARGSTQSNFIRVFTFYGICSANYVRADGSDEFIHDQQNVLGRSCVLKE